MDANFNVSNSSFSKIKPSFILIPALNMGLTDSVNPCLMSTLLIFIILLLFLSDSLKKVTICGSFFMFSLTLSNLFIIFGRYDAFYSYSHNINIVRLIYLIMAVLFIAFGGINFYDWIKFKKTNDTDSFIIKFKGLNEKIKNNPSRIQMVFLSLLSSGLATGLSILQSISTKDYNIFINFLYTIKSGDKVTAFLSLAIYCLAVIFPISTVFIISILVLKLKSLKKLLLRGVSLIKIVFSAIFLSIGIGLIFVFA